MSSIIAVRDMAATFKPKIQSAMLRRLPKSAALSCARVTSQTAF